MKIADLIKHTMAYQCDEWFEKRDSILTASNVSSVLNYNDHLSRNDLLNKMLNKTRNNDSYSTLHGKKYEPLAIKYLSNKLDVHIKEPGLKIHKDYDFLGATPDGIFQKNGEICLVEIKCPTSRKIDGKIPYNYFCQMQLQMEVWDINTCIFYELEIKEYDTYHVNANYYGHIDNKHIYINKENLLYVKRDKTWFNQHLSTFKDFVDELRGSNKSVSIVKQSRKRKYSEMTETFLTQTRKSSRLNDNIKKIVIPERWFSTCHLQDYVINDKLHTWLNLHGSKYYESEKNPFNELILDRHSIYTMDLINKLNKNHTVYNIPKYSGYNEDINNLSLRLIKEKKYDILINPILMDDTKKLFSKIDILMKGKIIKEKNIFVDDNFVIDKIKDDIYYPITICLAKLELLKNKTLSNSVTKYKYYKEKLNIEVSILNKIQENDINETFIWNNGIKYNNKEYKRHLFAHYSEENNYDNFIEWFRYIEYKTHEEVLEDEEFYPIMTGNKYSNWEDVEKTLSKDVKEITLLSNVGLKIREKIRERNIFSFQDVDKAFKAIGKISNNKNFELIKKSFTIKEKIDMGLSKKTKWLTEHKLELYVDFETVNEFCGGIDMIYLIGMYVSQEDKFYYFLADDLTETSENTIIDKWIAKMDELKQKYKYNNAPIYHWAPAEKIFLRNNERKRKVVYQNLNFVDIYKNLKDNNVVIKNNYEGYGLKKVVKSLNALDLLDMSYEDSKCSSGDKSIITALNYYNKNDKDELKAIIHYNFIDCKIMYKIMEVLRNFKK